MSETESNLKKLQRGAGKRFPVPQKYIQVQDCAKVLDFNVRQIDCLQMCSVHDNSSWPFHFPCLLRNLCLHRKNMQSPRNWFIPDSSNHHVFCTSRTILKVPTYLWSWVDASFTFNDWFFCFVFWRWEGTLASSPSPHQSKFFAQYWTLWSGPNCLQAERHFWGECLRFVACIVY